MFAAIRFPEWISPNVFTIGDSFALKWYGLAYVAGFLCGYLYGTGLARNRPLWQTGVAYSGEVKVPSKPVLEDYIFWIMVGIIAGGRIGYTLFYNLADTIQNPISLFKVWEGGMSFHGGLIGVALAVLWVARKHKQNLFRLGDIVAASTPFGLFFGRMANFINAELYGRATDLPWAFIFPVYDRDGNVAGYTQPVHPSQLYEALLEGVILFLILRLATHKFKSLTRPGKTAGLFLIFYGLFRTSVELVREPDNIPQVSEYLTRGMLYSIPMILIGLWLVWRAHKKGPVEPVFEDDATESEAAQA